MALLWFIMYRGYHVKERYFIAFVKSLIESCFAMCAERRE